MEPTIKMLVYEQTIVYGNEDSRVAKVATPRMYIPFETVLLSYLDGRIQDREFEKDSPLYNQTFRRMNEEPKMLIKWLCAQPIENWKQYLSLPDGRIPDADLDTWEYGWSDFNNWTVDNFDLIHKENFITHDKKIVKPIGKTRMNDFASVFGIPDREDPDGMYRIVMALYRGDGEKGTNYISLNEDYVQIPLFRRMEHGGIIPGVEIGQLIVAARYFLECSTRNGNDSLAAQLIELCDRFLELDQDRRNIQIEKQFL